MKRRSFLASAAVTPLLATGIQAKTVDPIIAHHKGYLANMKLYEDVPESALVTDVETAYIKASWVHSRKVCGSTPITIEGLVSQLEHYRHQFLQEGESWKDDIDIQLIDNAIAGAKRLANQGETFTGRVL